MPHIVALSSRQPCVPKNNPLFLLPPFTKLHLKFRYRNLNLTNIKINQSINSTEQDNNLQKNIIINTISHFNVSLMCLERVIQISEISRFARKTENTAQINSITFDLRIQLLFGQSTSAERFVCYILWP